MAEHSSVKRLRYSEAYTNRQQGSSKPIEPTPHRFKTDLNPARQHDLSDQLLTTTDSACFHAAYKRSLPSCPQTTPALASARSQAAARLCQQFDKTDCRRSIDARPVARIDATAVQDSSISTGIEPAWARCAITRSYTLVNSLSSKPSVRNQVDRCFYGCLG